LQRKTKKFAPILLFLLVFAALMCGLLYFYLTGQPEPVSAEQISDALISQDLQPVDITDTAQGNFPGAGLTDCIVAKQDDIRFEFYTFDNPSNALRVYREARKRIITTKMETPRVEIEQGKANYKYYSLAAGGNYSVTVYVKNTAIYAYCAEENQSKIIGILDTIGYVDAEPEQDISPWAAAGMKILPFVLYLFLAMVCRSFWWRAAYISAGATQKQMDDLETTRKELSRWIVEISPRASTTRTILTVYKLFLLPGYVGIALAVISCFTEGMDAMISTLGVVLPALFVVMGLLGAWLGSRLKK